jgi:hypothetical protein
VRLIARRSVAWIVAVIASFALVDAVPAQALISPPVTVDGPSSEILSFGGVAMASDGSGGLVYLKSIGGIPHVFASRYLNGSWSGPMRVDWERPFQASEPTIAAAPNGQLMVAWETKVLRVKGKPQYALYAARIPVGGETFGHAQLIDPNVGEGVGLAPSLAGTAPGKAIVAYRVITDSFTGTALDPNIQLRPGDVMAEIRLARLSGERWSRLGAVNANLESSMRPPAPGNGPEVGIGLEGNSVVAWQEPEPTGTARIWERRVFGNSFGPIQQASPSTWEGTPVTADAESFSLSVTGYAGAELAMRIGQGIGSSLNGRLLLSSLPPNFDTGAATLGAARYADNSATGPGAPTVAAAESSTRKLLGRVAFVAGGAPRQMEMNASGNLVEVGMPGASPAAGAAEAVGTIDPEGGGFLAYPSTGPSGPAVAVRQEFPGGNVQTGFVAGTQGGPISQLAIGRSGGGDGLIGFLQGEVGGAEIVADAVGAPPATFSLKAPTKWLKANAVKLHWQPAPSAVGGITYGLVINGQVIRAGLKTLNYRPRPALLATGVLSAQVLATDSLGQQQLSPPVKLRVDGTPPRATVTAKGGDKLLVRITDVGSGVSAKTTHVRFGDGEGDRRGAKFHHTYAGPGTYTVTVSARDKVGNGYHARFRVKVR